MQSERSFLIQETLPKEVLFVFRIESHSRMKKTRKAIVPLAETALKRHFGKRPLQDLITASRTLPVTARVDVQLALDKMFADIQRPNWSEFTPSINMKP